MKTKPIPHGLMLSLGLAVALVGTPAAIAACSTATSPAFSADLRDAGIAVSGRVRDSQTKAAIGGAQVTLAGQSTATSASGDYAFASVNLANGNTLTVSKTGYATATKTVTPLPGALQHVEPEILLKTTVTNKPVITRMGTKYGGLFLAQLAIENEGYAIVDWGYTTAGSVRFYANDKLIQTVTGAGPEYVCPFNLDQWFGASLARGANQLKAIARSSNGVESDPVVLELFVIPMPSALRPFAPLFTVQNNGPSIHAGLDFSFPDPGIQKTLTLPVIGKFGVELAANASFDYTFGDGDWEAALGIGAENSTGKRGRRPLIPGLPRHPKLKLYLGNTEVSGKLEGGARGTATIEQGIAFREVFGRASLDTKLEVGRFGLLDALFPGLSAWLKPIPGLGDKLKAVSVIIYAKPGVSGEVILGLDPKFQFNRVEATGKIGVEAAYEPKLLGAEAHIYVGGEPSLTLQVPGDFFKELRFRAYCGFDADLWLITIGPVEYVFVDVSYPGGSGLLPLPAGDGTPGQSQFRMLIGAGRNQMFKTRNRSYLLQGGERFLLGQAMRKTSLITDDKLTSLAQFRLMGQSESAKSAAASPSNAQNPGPTRSLEQADLPLVQNAFPSSSPALAGFSQELMLLYVADNGSSNSLQCTDIKWTHWDGTNWTVPAAILSDTRAEFSPQVAFDSGGNAIAVWERIADTNFNQLDLTAMAAQMEIVWAIWNRTNATWSTPAALTANNVLDHAPLLCGPMSDGSVLAVWTRNNANLLMGTNGAGSQVLCAQWSPGSQSWSEPQVLISDLPYRLSQSLAGASNRAVYAWTRDLDGALTNSSNQQVFYYQWQDGAWGAATQFTTNATGNGNVRVAVSPAGDAFLIWQQETNLVMNRNFSTNTTLVRADSQTAGFSDYAMTFGPAGNLVLIWQEMSTNGSDARYMVFDPTSGTWSKDAFLCNDMPLERSFAPVWDDVGNLTVAYNKVELFYTNRTVALDGGGSITISNVLQPGRVDLVVTKRKLIKDLVLAAGDFTACGGNFLPGDAVTLSALVRNTGDLGITNVMVSFYDGNPTNGGTLITNVPLAGWLEGAATNLLTALWVVPEPATNHTLYAFVNRTNAASEFNPSNNVQSINVGGTDLAVSLVAQSVETNGALRVIAQVQNLGAPSAANTVLAIRRDGQAGAPLATIGVPLLEPGMLAQVALDLPAGTQPEGEAVYRLFADETRVVTDVDTNNNTVAFAVNLWLDADGDGMPDGWETQFGFSPTNAADATLDFDGDGMSNLAEYRAGTDPKNAQSYLRIQSLVADGTNGLQITWGSAPNRLYSVLRSTTITNYFEPIAVNILSSPPENTYLDTTATNGTQYFYRLKLE